MITGTPAATVQNGGTTMEQATQAHAPLQHRHDDHRAERRLMLFLYCLSYPLCLIAAVAGRTGAFFGKAGMRVRESVFAEAKSAACAAVGYAFRA
ncbi:hypothetical protein ACLB6G_18845 [Zhengella sp. ZM62]|uniref:hypothetical protein n=1 Tax=Zhengella sedimenti TaxID=3390035 RepID=UPI0039763D9E